ncbi:MAG: hypothetical protein CVV27_12580 [Candidatus Melainabacteria bacterium HGW-Melainabacteria-1]|nr:MAG: hypothetical protein CVV27_12580 [Candidatus Melainabacteria bacterium HGW-Melainabacteria-1]
MTQKIPSGKSKSELTRARILDAALELFNRDGVEAVSTRQIAAAAGLSQGNLCYHFPAKDQIVETLYRQLWQAFEAMLAQRPQTQRQLADQPLATWMVLRTQYRYRFLMLDFVRLMRTYPEILAHFRAAVPHRQAQFQAIFAAYIAKGWMEPEPVPGAHQRLVMQCYVLGDFWMAEAEILFEGSEAELLLHYTGLICGMFWPYLTVQGRKILDQAQAELPMAIAELGQ